MEMVRKWNEADHPRDGDGRFTDGPGGDWAGRTLSAAGYGRKTKTSRGRSGRRTTPQEVMRGADRLDPMTRHAIGQAEPGVRGRARSREVNSPNEYAEVDSDDWARKALGMWGEAVSGENNPPNRPKDRAAYNETMLEEGQSYVDANDEAAAEYDPDEDGDDGIDYTPDETLNALVGQLRYAIQSGDSANADRLADELRSFLIVAGYTDDEDMPTPPGTRV
jgi:hypothetical protein